MALPFDVANFNLTNFANNYNNIFDSTPVNVDIQVKDSEGNITTKTVANRGMFKQQLWDDVGGALGQFNKTVYVDGENGDDNNDGSSLNPFKSFKKACDSVPAGGFASIHINNTVFIDDDIALYHKNITVTIHDSSQLLHKWHLASNGEAVLYRFYMNKSNFTIYIESNNDTDEHIYYGALDNDTGVTDIYYLNNLFYSNADNSNNTITFSFRNHNDNGVVINIPANTEFFRQVGSSEDKKSDTVNISGYYTGSIKIHSTSKLVVFYGVLIFTFDFALKDEDGNDVDVTTKVYGIVKDSNGVPRNVTSNIIF